MRAELEVILVGMRKELARGEQQHNAEVAVEMGSLISSSSPCPLLLPYT